MLLETYSVARGGLRVRVRNGTKHVPTLSGEVSLNRCNSKRVGGSGLGLWARPSAMTRIPGKSFSPQYPQLLAGPLNLVIFLNVNVYCEEFSF